MTDTIDRATARRVLDLPLLYGNDAGVATIRDYLIKLLTTLWEEQDSFDAKAPFGNAGWNVDIYLVLLRAELIEGTAGEFNDERGDALMNAAIAELGRPQDG